MLDLSALKTEMQTKMSEVENAATNLETLRGKSDAPADDLKTAQEVYEQLTGEFDALEGKVAEAEKHAKRKAMLKRVREMNEPESQIAGKVADSGMPTVPAEPRDDIARGMAHRDAFMSWIKGKSVDGEKQKLLTPTSSSILDSDNDEAKSSVVLPPHLAAGIMGGNYARTFGKVVMSVDNAVTNPSLANNLVPQDYRATLQRLPFDQPTLLDRVTIIPSSTGVVTFPSLTQTDGNEFGGISFSWVTEASEKPETEPRFNQIEVTTYELCGYTEVSERALSRSAISIEALLMVLVKGAMNFTLDNAIINGAGAASNQPTGIINTAGIRTVTRQTAGTVTDRDLVRLKHAVKPAHRSGSMYALNDDVEQALEETTDTFGRPLFRASTANGAYDRLVGYPYEVAENCPSIGNLGDVIYGNPKWYFLAMEEEITIAKSKDYRFRHNVVAFKFFVVVGGRLMQPRAMAVLNDTVS